MRPYSQGEFMKRFAALALLIAIGTPAFAKTHKDPFEVPCNTLWSAIKDTLKNSGKYVIVSIDENEMLASYRIGSMLTSTRINSVSLNPQASGCEMQVQTSYSGWENNDAGDFKKRVEASLTKLKSPPPADKTAPDPGLSKRN